MAKRKTEWKGARRWTTEQGEAALEALDASGESAASFASQHGVDVHRLYMWRRRRREALGNAPTFVEVAPSEHVGRQPFEIELPTGERVSVPAAFEPDALRALLIVLRNIGAC